MSFDEQPDAPLHGECAAEIARIEQERDELAAQVVVLREALVSLLVAAPVHIECNNMGHAKKYQHRRYDEECPLVPMYTEAMLKAQKAITLPNTAADILRQRDARLLLEMAEKLEDYYATGGAAIDAVMMVREAANKLDRTELNKELIAHEIWAAAQLVPGEGIEDGVGRVVAILARIDAERGKSAATHQFQRTDGTWSGFIDQRHYEATVASGDWPIRALFLSPTPTIPEGMALVPPEKPLPDLMMASYHEAIGWNACRNAMLAAAQGEK